MSDLSDLIARVEKATRPDREIDLAVAFAIKWPLGADWRSFAEHEAKHDYETAWVAHRIWIGGIEGDRRIPKWTASPDAVVALVERERPFGLLPANFIRNVVAATEIHRAPDSAVAGWLARKLLAELLRAKQQDTGAK